MSYNAEHWHTHEPSMAASYRAEVDAEQGSANLLARILAAYDRHAASKRIRLDQAMGELLYGRRP